MFEAGVSGMKMANRHKTAGAVWNFFLLVVILKKTKEHKVCIDNPRKILLHFSKNPVCAAI